MSAVEGDDDVRSEADVAEADRIIDSLTVQRRRPTPWCWYTAKPEVSLARWVRERRGPLDSFADGAQAAVDWAAQLPDDPPGEPVAICTDRWLSSLPPYTADATVPYAVLRDGERRLVHVNVAAGVWIYVVEPGHLIDPAFLWGAYLGGWTLRRLA
ncbi:hypothetical protein [Nocardia noduli]|uniref:hypothetical protein n=1 Tax=Nocardia noduli TaxID=2815722 RepID=UPI001C24664E|nr:hypothetical protein [Nocardia noduli]